MPPAHSKSALCVLCAAALLLPGCGSQTDDRREVIAPLVRGASELGIGSAYAAESQAGSAGSRSRLHSTGPMHSQNSASTGAGKCRGKLIEATFAVENSGAKIDSCGTDVRGKRFCSPPTAKGYVMSEPTQRWKNVNNNSVTICGHGDSCFPAKSLQLTGNCAAIDTSRVNNNGDELENK